MPATRPLGMTILIVSARIAALCLVLYLLALTWLWFRQEKLLFAPDVLPADYKLAKAADIHEVSIDVPGAKLSALHLRLPNPKGVVFFLHGNGGSLVNWFVNPEFYRRANYDFFMVDYRGFGKSSGRIESEAQLHADVRAVWATVAPQYAGKKRVVYGRSLGSGLAAGLSAELAAGGAPDLTVLVSAYSSMVAVASEHYAWVPQAVLRYPLRTDQVVGQIRNPLLLIHGEKDTLIAPRHSDALKALVPQATLLNIVGAAHNDVQNFDDYLSAYGQALAKL
ncbi:MAG: alpha/beta fold hydrolase [Pseudomonadota bacterium]